jgi:hypothetical protein
LAKQVESGKSMGGGRSITSRFDSLTTIG